MTSRFIELAHKTDLYNFFVGCPVQGTMNARGQFVPYTRWDRVKARAATKWNHWTRWWRPRYVVTKIDYAAGAIRVTEERWSWTRWRWM